MAKAKAPKPPSKKLRKEFFKAYREDDVAAVTAHLDAGVDANTMLQLDWDRPALAAALERNTAPKIARLLLDRGADVKVASPKGSTPLHHVCDRDFAKELIDRGAEVNAKDSAGRTPLHTAADDKLLPVVEVLVACGAEVDVLDDEGKTPYHHALHVGIRAHLRAHGAKGIGPGGGKVITPTVTDDMQRDKISVERGAVGVDDRGTVWMGGYQGLFRYDGTSLACLKFSETFAFQDIAPGPPGVLYIATSWGLVKYAGDEWRLYNSGDSELFDNHLTFMTTGPDGRAYMVSYESEAEDKHVSIFDGENFSALVPGKDFPLGVELERVAFDKSGGMILCGRGGYAVRENGEWVLRSKLDPTSSFDSVVYDVVDDGEALWIGAQSGVYERRGENVTKHDVKNLAKHLLKDGETLWVGTYYGGLARIRGGEITIFDEKNSPLPHDDINGLVRAPDGTIWVHTSNGVAFVKNDELQRFTP